MTTRAEFSGTHMIVLPGGGYAAHAPHEAEPVARWLGQIGVPASVFRYPLNVRHPVPLEALRAEIGHAGQCLDLRTGVTAGITSDDVAAAPSARNT